MKNLLLILPLAACAAEPSLSLKRDNNTLAHKAYYWHGLSEENDRQTLKDITGVDPVTTEWCAAFVNMVLLEQDFPTSAAVSDYPLMARSFLFWGDEVVDEPKQGDIMIFERGNNGWQGHVAFYVSTTIIQGKEFYNVLGGNQNNKVSIEPYPASKLLSIRRLSSEPYYQKVAGIY